MLKINYNPDVLSCLANLSNDEVFTPPHIANQMLDLLPAEIWSDKNATFLDPMCKSGVFLREIAKRLIKGLEEEIPDIQARINHVFTRQLYGIAITELTSLLSRRSVYCSKLANSKYSVCEDFKNPTGNIKHGRIEHKWAGERCVFCGATRAVYDRSEELESYAYEFIHTTNPQYKGLLKVGFTSVNVEKRVGEQYPTLRPGELPYKIVLEHSAMRNDGSSFTDHEVHRCLKKKGIRSPKGEWFECSVQDVKAAIIAVRDGVENEENRTLDFAMRPKRFLTARMN